MSEEADHGGNRGARLTDEQLAEKIVDGRPKGDDPTPVRYGKLQRGPPLRGMAAFTVECPRRQAPASRGSRAMLYTRQPDRHWRIGAHDSRATGEATVMIQGVPRFVIDGDPPQRRRLNGLAAAVVPRTRFVDPVRGL